MTPPTKVRAIDITPYDFGIWCRIQDGEPFVNEIVSRKWDEAGGKIWFMLDSHNCVSATPDELLEVVPLPRSPYQSAELRERIRARDEAYMRVAPLAFEVSDVY